jgi:hypothetical protein
MRVWQKQRLSAPQTFTNFGQRWMNRGWKWLQNIL